MIFGHTASALTKSDPLLLSKTDPELTAEPAIEKAFSTLNTLYLDNDEREVYKARLKWLRDEDAALKTAHEKERTDGLEEGRKESLKEFN